MRRKLACGSAFAMALVFGLAASASAQTLGSTVAGTTSGRCFNGGIVTTEQTSDPSTPYTVPAGGGQITDWSTNTTQDTAGANLTLVVVKPNSDGTATVVGTDSETLPTPLPASGVATFTLATPISVSGGETLGLYSSDASNPNDPVCIWEGGVSTNDTVTTFSEPSAPAAGQTLAAGGPGPSPAGIAMNVAATLRTMQDAGVTKSAAPDTTTVGNSAVFASTVTNAGPDAAPITFTDSVPAGLSVEFAVAGSGACTTSGQVVTCTISGLAAGQSTTVGIVVKPTATGTYTNTASVALPTGATDPNAANNSASATLTVLPAGPAPSCLVPKLRGLKLSFAKRLVRLLGCKAGRVTHVHSGHKGDVIRTIPGPGTFAANTVVSFVVSSGPARHHHK